MYVQSKSGGKALSPAELENLWHQAGRVESLQAELNEVSNPRVQPARSIRARVRSRRIDMEIPVRALSRTEEGFWQLILGLDAFL